MDQKQNDQQSSQQSGPTEQNPTLKDLGTSVPDYGNVMGGASDANVQQGQEENRQQNDRRSGEDSDTAGNP
ncbi:MAG: hypothetical protein M3Q06_07460 [Bacteroidota bacterium]|nr:hypothetical protein [Bacteroidota bacterium]